MLTVAVNLTPLSDVVLNSAGNGSRPPSKIGAPRNRSIGTCSSITILEALPAGGLNSTVINSVASGRETEPRGRMFNLFPSAEVRTEKRRVVFGRETENNSSTMTVCARPLCGTRRHPARVISKVSSSEPKYTVTEGGGARNDRAASWS